MLYLAKVLNYICFLSALLFLPLNMCYVFFICKDYDGEHARRALQRMGGGPLGGRGQDMGPGGMNIPPSIANNPNIPPEVIHALQAGRLGNTVFVANVSTKP